MQLFLVGAGHVGLVTAAGLARLGHHVVVSDIDAGRIERLAAGEPPIYEPGLREAISDLRDRLAFTTEPRPPGGTRFSFVCVATPTDESGPLSLGQVRSVVGGLLEWTDREHTIVVRSTLPLDGPSVLAAMRSGREDAPALVTNPEFMREGSGLRDFERPGRLMAGWVERRDEAAARAALDLYDGIEGPRLVADAGSVALIKVASNVYLGMKVAYANELARISESIGADVRIVADGIGFDSRIGRAFLDAGPGFGGSCLPEQASALALDVARRGMDAPLISSIGPSNQRHQAAITERLAALLGGSLPGRRVAIFGLAFKANTDDVRDSPALALAALLRGAGASVVGTDPRAIARAARSDPLLEVATDPAAAAAGADAILVATEWPEYATLDWPAIARGMRGHLVFDTRSIVDAAAAEAAGLRIARLGRPDGPTST